MSWNRDYDCGEFDNIENFLESRNKNWRDNSKVDTPLVCKFPDALKEKKFSNNKDIAFS